MTIENNANTASQNDGEHASVEAGGEPPLELVDGNEEPVNNRGVRTAATSSENPTIPASPAASVKCQFLPHGVYAIIPALFATTAWFSCLSQNGCDYARVTGPIVADITNNPAIPFIEAGFSHYREPTLNTANGEWVVDLRVQCEEYNTDIVNIDGAWTFAKITSFLSLVLGGGGAMFIWFSSCFVFTKSVWLWAGYELMFATVLQALTYTWFATSLCHGNDGQDKCTMYYGARADVLACVMWAASALCIFCKYPREKNRGRNSAQQPEVEMSNRSEEMRAGAVVDDDHQIT